jgi:hypothetical protein
MTEQTKLIFYRLLDKDLLLKDFEQFIYNNDQIKSELQADLYLDLISIDYNLKGSYWELCNKIEPYIDKNEFYLWQTKRLLSDIIDNKIDLVFATRKLRDLYFATGENFIPIKLGVGYDSELDELPTPDEYDQWNEQELKEKLKKVDWYRDDIIHDAKIFLDELKNK